MLVMLAGNNPFGKVENPVGTLGDNPSADLGSLIAGGILMAFVIAGLFALLYGLWGAIDWITSGGDKEKLRKAQGKIRDALLGVIILVVVLAIFVTLFQVVLGGRIIRFEGGSIQFTLPTINDTGGGGSDPVQCPGCPPL